MIMKKLLLITMGLSCVSVGSAMNPEDVRRMGEENANLRAQVTELREQNDGMFTALQQTSAQSVVASESTSLANLVNREYFDIIMGQFSEQLQNLSAFVQRGQMTLEAALSIAESEHRRSMETVLVMAGTRHRDQLENEATRNRVELDHQQEINRLERERLQAIADAERTKREAEEKERILVARIGGIVGHCKLDPVSDRISYGSLDISRMDVFQRHNIVSEIYEKKFVPFREFLVSENLDQIKRYLVSTKIDMPLPKHPDTIMGSVPDFFS
jgi:hypothetical protein